MRALLAALLLVQGSGALAAPDAEAVLKDERGLWAEAEEFEREVKTSRLLVDEPSVNAYLNRVLCRAVGAEKCAKARIYLLRIPVMNAAMSPNGMLLVYSGLLLRVRSEAELAAVLAHEYAHFQERHGVKSLRKKRSATSWSAWVMVASGRSPSLGVVGVFLASYFSFSRDQEREADLIGLKSLADGGYSAMSASTIWLHAREEQDAAAVGLSVRSLKDRDGGMFQSHPMDVERMSYLARAAQGLERPGAIEGGAEYRAAVAPIWSMLVDDQIKLNDFGASEYILASLANGNWTGPLLFARAELYRARRDGPDLLTAEMLYRRAIVRDDAPAEAWRGLGLVLSRLGRSEEAATMLRTYLERQPDAKDRATLTALIQGE